MESLYSPGFYDFVLVLLPRIHVFTTRIPLTSTGVVPQIDAGWNRIPRGSPE